MEKWLVYSKKAEFENIAKEFNISPILARVIRNRDVAGTRKIKEYLNGTIEDMHSPWKLKDMERAVKIIRTKIKLSQKIRVVSDYDLDGICAAYILVGGLEDLGARVDLKIPNRITDGYGINDDIIKTAYAEGIDTIVTCDNGIAAIDSINYAKKLGMTVIVTDHHEVPFEEKWSKREYLTSEADAIINPKQEECEYPYKEICGATVAYKLIEALYEEFEKDTKEVLKYLQFAAIATVGDVVELLGENRIIVKAGLMMLNRNTNMGLNKLIKVNNLADKVINSYHIGFVLGPCLNAAGRLDTAGTAFDLLREKDTGKAMKLAVQLTELNKTRKNMTEKGVVTAKEDLKAFDMHPVIVIYLPDCHESVAGIIAGRIRDYCYKPTIILTSAKEGVKGSGRSIEGYNMYDELAKCKKLLTKFGGHAMAAGLSLEEENVDVLRNMLNRICRLSQTDLTQKIWIDVPMPFEYASMQLVEQLKILEPFGKGNEKPIFGEKGISILSLKVLGANQNVVRLKLANHTGCIMKGVCFEEGEKMIAYLKEQFGEQEVQKAMAGIPNGIRLNIVYYPEINEYNGFKDVQVVIKRYM